MKTMTPTLKTMTQTFFDMNNVNINSDESLDEGGKTSDTITASRDCEA